jgi:hypothetical protein
MSTFGDPEHKYRILIRRFIESRGPAEFSSSCTAFSEPKRPRRGFGDQDCVSIAEITQQIRDIRTPMGDHLTKEVYIRHARFNMGNNCIRIDGHRAGGMRRRRQ